MRRSRLVGLAVAIALLAGVAAAEDVVVATANGMPGTDGANGEPGGDGGDSSTATAVAPGVDPQVAAVASAGDGGEGGSGADQIGFEVFRAVDSLFRNSSINRSRSVLCSATRLAIFWYCSGSW